MTADRSLDEFVSSSQEEDDTTTPPAPREGTEANEDGPQVSEAPEAVEPIASTRSWTPDGAACEECGRTVQERWRAADGLVCADCKEW